MTGLGGTGGVHRRRRVTAATTLCYIPRLWYCFGAHDLLLALVLLTSLLEHATHDVGQVVGILLRNVQLVPLDLCRLLSLSDSASSGILQFLFCATPVIQGCMGSLLIYN